MLRAVGVMVLAVTLAGLALSSSANAERRGLSAELEVRASNGYQVTIGAHRWRHPRRPAKLSVLVSKDETFSAYSTHAVLTKRKLNADLGRFGRIALRYRPDTQDAGAARLRAAPQAGSLVTKFFQRLLGCAVSIEGSGHFKGRIRFRGEDGYTRVRARRARGFISPATASCSNVRSVHGVALDARSGSVAFEADRFRKQRGGGAGFIAQATEKSGDVAIQRFAFDGGYAKSFTYDSALSSAHVEPMPGPFTGSADLGSSGAWTGSLAVSFPGAPAVPLAGPGFAARLARF